MRLIFTKRRSALYYLSIGAGIGAVLSLAMIAGFLVVVL